MQIKLKGRAQALGPVQQTDPTTCYDPDYFPHSGYSGHIQSFGIPSSTEGTFSHTLATGQG